MTIGSLKSSWLVVDELEDVDAPGLELGLLDGLALDEMLEEAGDV